MNVLFGADLSKFVREGNTRGLFKDRAVVSMLTGEPEYLDPLKDETPNGWIVTGYPGTVSERPTQLLLGLSPQVQRLSPPRIGGGLYGHQVLDRRHEKAKDTETSKMVEPSKASLLKARWAKSPTVVWTTSPPWARLLDKTKNEGGKGTMVDYVYLDAPVHATRRAGQKTARSKRSPK